MKKCTFFLTLACLMSCLILAVFIPAGTAHASSLSIGTITPNANVPAGTAISFDLTITDFASPHYTLTDSLPGSTLSNSNISINGQFNWTPSALDIGTHSIIFNAADAAGNIRTLSQTLIVRQFSPLSIQSLSPGANFFLNNDNALSFIVAAEGFINPSFVISDSFPGSSISSTNINSNGSVSWKPVAGDVGIHNLTVRVYGLGGRTDSVYQTVTVNGISIQSVSLAKLHAGTPLTFTVVPYGMNSPSYNIGDSFRNNTLQEGKFIGNNFSWTPQTQDVGTHSLTVTGVDGSNTSTATLTITVIPHEAPSAPAPTTPSAAPVAAPVVAPVFTLALHLGSSGSQVTALQKLLTKLHFYSSPITGYYGPLTVKAVSAFQKANKISALGTVGPATRAALNKK